MRPACISRLLVLAMLTCTAAHADEPEKQPPKADKPRAIEPATREQAERQQKTGPTRPAVKFPDPLITEVLYAVPGGADGDADGDGVRSATGDEFVELINPHDKPIQLRGYTLTDGVSPKGGDDSQLRFVFPAVTLKPGQCVVVFNGFTDEDSERIGQKRKDAVRGDDGVPEPIVLNMHVRSAYVALANTADVVLLTDPKGRAVQSIEWGEEDQQVKLPEKMPPLREAAPTGRGGSVTRVGAAAGLIAHRDLPHEEGTPAEAFSPGRHALDAVLSEEEEVGVTPPQREAKKNDEPKEHK